ncbi:GRAM domain-containing protein, partial [Stagonosporopsis vannaccii]
SADSADSAGAGAARPRPAAAPSDSDDSLGLHKSVASSLLTDDSDLDAEPAASPVRRPGISPHHSHAGLLTLSSPLIASETIDSLDSAASAASATTATDATLADPLTSTDVGPARAPSALDTAPNKRGVSPVGKLKEAFTPTRRATSPRPAADTDSAKSGTSAGGIGSLFGGKKREQRVLDKPAIASPPQIHAGPETQSTPSLRSLGPKLIVTQLPETPPNTVDAPTTFVTPPTPVDGPVVSPTESTHSKNAIKHSPSQSNPNVVVSPSGNMISHRRVRSTSNAPSKLSNYISAPLTPHPEEAKTPGGTAVPNPQSPGTGFFSSVFSAAQNAANQFSNTITQNTAAKNKADKQQPKEPDTAKDGGEQVIGPANVEATTDGADRPRPAIETLGSGNLSLAQLGISESSEVSPMSSATNVTIKADEASAKVEDAAAADAVSAAYAAKPPSVNSDRPRSLNVDAGGPGAASPKREGDVTDSPAAGSIQRQGSIRSRISGGRRRRHRGSSAATGNTIAAAIGASTSTLAPAAALQGHRLNGTGFAVAPPKRNKDFHNLFKSVPEDDYLIEDYSAALQKEILLHGRLYVSEGHLCFSSNILGWVTNLVISFDEVVSVEKKSTAVLFPNAIVIQTLHARNVFASFLARDSTYDLIIGIWKISHPNLKSSLNGVTLDGSAGTGDKTEKAESVGSDVGTSESDDEVYDEDADDDDGIGSFTEAGEGSVAGSDLGSSAGDAPATRKVSAAVAQAVGSGGQTAEAAKTATNGAAAATNDFPGSATHAPSDCADSDKHYDKLLIDTTIPAPLGKVYSLMFGPGADVFMRKWLIEDQKSTDLQMEHDKDGLGEKKTSFNYAYTKPLSAPVGPKQTRCNIEMTLEQYDLDRAVSVNCSTHTPDVPSGNIFLTKTRYCMMWGPGNSTRLIMTFTVEWSGKSWLRGPIEKGANDGQMSYATSLTAALRTAVASKISSGPKTPGRNGKSKKRSKTAALEEAPIIAAPAAPQPKQSNWGVLEPIRPLVPFADTIESLLTPQVIIAILGALLLYTHFFRGGAPAASGPHAWSTAQRHVAYDEIWRTEESELWKWLEQRVAIDRVQHEAGGKFVPDEQQHQQQQRVEPRDMKEREIDEAIRVTELRLKEMKAQVEKERERSRTKSPKEKAT